MKDQLTRRLEELRSEFAKGEQALAKLDSDAAQLRQTLLRISGAIQVLEELLKEEGGGSPAIAAGGPASGV